MFDVKAKIDSLSQNILAMQEIMMKQGGFQMSTQTPGKPSRSGDQKGRQRSGNDPFIQVDKINSENTIYQNALEQVKVDEFMRNCKERGEANNRFRWAL